MSHHTLSREKIIQEINETLKKLLELDDCSQLTPETDLFAGLGMDSLDAIDLAISCKKQFGIEFNESDMRSIRTLGDIYTTVERYIRGEQSESFKPHL